MACATVFMNISLPAFEMNFSFHPKTLLEILSCISLKVVVLALPPTIDKPRYFSQSIIILAPSMFLIDSLVSCLAFRLKKREVFCRFMACPEANSYCTKILGNTWHS